MKSHSLLELSESIERVITRTFNNSYWVRAEISRLNFYPKSGHCYPELVEKKEGKIVAEIRSTIWRNTYQSLTAKFKSQTGEDLREGMNVLFLVNVKYSPRHGISLSIVDIDPSFSLGEMAKEKKLSIETLRKEGLFAKNQDIEFPFLPQRLAIISVSTSKGYHDFLETIQFKASRFDIRMQLFPAILQGDVAVSSITEQLGLIQKRVIDFDLVLIIRGGGGDVGLHCYNNVEMARSVASFPIPVITGIGHSTNETVVEMVANQNKITPTAVADLLVERFKDLENDLRYSQQILERVPQNFIEPRKQLLLNQIQYLKAAAAEPINQQKLKIQGLGNQVQNATQSRFQNERSKLDLKLLGAIQYLSKTKINSALNHISHIEEKIQLLDPKNTLKRGFTMSLVNGKTVTDIHQMKVGNILETVLYNGKIESKITKSTHNE